MPTAFPRKCDQGMQNNETRNAVDMSGVVWAIETVLEVPLVAIDNAHF